MSKQIFDVDVKGLRQLQEGKPKWFIIRELLQNAMDEEVTQINVTIRHDRGRAKITVEDNSPTGFRDLKDAFTLFGDTYKRSDPTKRGRFNFGEKQVICVCEVARIHTTTGGVCFDVTNGLRSTFRKKRETGSEVYVEVKMTKDECSECIEYLNTLKVRGARVFVMTDMDNKTLGFPHQHKSFDAKLLTEQKADGFMKRIQRESLVYIYKESKAYLYELGIPVCEIECDYSIDVQQRVPLSPDRDTVDAKYLKTLYGEVLNHTIEEINADQSSNLWVRDGFTSDRANKQTRHEIITKRFGEKALIANPNDRRSMDEAISNNYNVIYGSEMSKDEWAAVKNDGLLISTSSMFKTGIAEGRMVNDPSTEMITIGTFAGKIARQMLGINVRVAFYDSPDATVKADYNSDTNVLRFNVAHFDKSEWELTDRGWVKQEMLDLIIHELGHSRGLHYEHSYHECITELGAKLTLKALAEPKWFQI